MVKNILEIDLLDELGLDTLPAEKQTMLLESIADALMTTIIARMLPLLNEDDQKAFDVLLDTSKDPSDVREFLSARVPNFYDIVNEEVATFKTEALEFYKALA